MFQETSRSKVSSPFFKDKDCRRTRTTTTKKLVTPRAKLYCVVNILIPFLANRQQLFFFFLSPNLALFISELSLKESIPTKHSFSLAQKVIICLHHQNSPAYSEHNYSPSHLYLWQRSGHIVDACECKKNNLSKKPNALRQRCSSPPAHSFYPYIRPPGMNILLRLVPNELRTLNRKRHSIITR